jgi:hypothetical protein
MIRADKPHALGFFLMHELDPLSSIRRLAGMVRDGGRIVVQEWHYASILWARTSAWPSLPLYREFARWSIGGLRHRGAHADMGLRLVNSFAQAGLAPPALRSDPRIRSCAGLARIRGAPGTGDGGIRGTLRISRAAQAVTQRRNHALTS